MYFLTLQRLLISSPGPQETVTHVLLNTFLFSLHGIDLVPSVIQFPPFCLQEHPILFRSLLMALNKYTFWDLTEQAVLFQTTSKAACSKHELVQSWDGACPAYSLWPFLIPNSLLSTTACMGRGPQPWPHTKPLESFLSSWGSGHSPNDIRISRWGPGILESGPGDCSKEPRWETLSEVGI